MSNPENQSNEPSPEDIEGGSHDPYKKGANEVLWLKDPEFDFENKKEKDLHEKGDNTSSGGQDHKSKENEPPTEVESDLELDYKNTIEQLENENSFLKEMLQKTTKHLETRTDIAEKAIKQIEELKIEQQAEEDINLNELLEKDERDFKKWLNELDPQAQKTLFEEIPEYKAFIDKGEEGKLKSGSPEYTGSEETTTVLDETIFSKETPKTIKIEQPVSTKKTTKEKGTDTPYIKIPSFNPEEYFAVPDKGTFDPKKPFEERNKGSSAKAQWAHATYRKGYGRAGLKTEWKKDVEKTTEQLQEQEKIVLLDYYQELIKDIEKQGENLESPKIAKQIRETMIDAKKELEQHLVKNYGNKVHQERRSNWWRRFRNLLNSDVAERKTLGDASDLVAINGGNIENAMATIENLAIEEIVERMNAHVRRSIKKSLDWSGKKDGYISADNEEYDRHQTYRMLQDEYLQRMAQDIREEGLSTDKEGTVESILSAQKPRLETIEKGVKQKRIKDLKNKLIVAGVSALIAAGLLLGSGGAVKAHLEKPKDAFIKPPTKIEQKSIEHKVDIITDQPDKVETKGEVSEKIIVADMGDEELHLDPETQKVSFVAKDLNKNLEDSKIIDKQKQEFHTLLSKIQVLTAGVEDNYISKTAKINSLKKLLNLWSSLDSNTQERFNEYVHELGGYGSLAKSMFPNEDIDQYAERMIQELQ